MTKIRDVMTKDPITLAASTPLVDAATRMRDADIGDVLVDSDGTLGIVTDRDITIRAVAEGTIERTLGDVASFDLDTVGPDDDLDEVVKDMREDAIRRVPVLEDGAAVGILAIGDLAVMRDEHSALADISAAPSNQ
jgi:signal-transduction protein with cAMP-binding, CBS, and nucleotidyltransferase domain